MRYLFCRLRSLLFMPLLVLPLISCGGGGSGSSEDSSTQKDSACLDVNYTPIEEFIEVAPDPLIYGQWHLEALGILSDSWDWLVDSSGKGVQIAVLDNNLDYEHEDLYDNINHDQSCRFQDSKSLNKDTHATEVAGVIAAVRDNNLGIVGVAPEANIIGFNILRTDRVVSYWNIALGGEGSVQAANVDIFNQSFTQTNITTPLDYNLTTDAALAYGTEFRRSGKGALYFKAAGNHFDAQESCFETIRALPLENANMDPDNNIPYNIVVGSATEQGEKACYSASGSSLMFVAPSHYIRTTTDNNNYVYFSGTSAATPIASGIAALILEKRPDLGWRDVRHIMLSTAQAIDTGITQKTLTLADGDYIAEPSWQTNGAGYNFHNWYGFGQISAIESITAAEHYSTKLPPQQVLTSDSITVNSPIPDFQTTGISSTLTLDQGLTVETAQLSIQLSHTEPSELSIELISPSGSRSVLMTADNIYSTQSNDTFELVLASNLFYGESAAGQWQVKVVDTQAIEDGADADNTHGQLLSWSLNIYGY